MTQPSAKRMTGQHELAVAGTSMLDDRAYHLAIAALAVACVWCASGLVAMELSSLIQTTLASWLLSLKQYTAAPCIAVLLTTAPVSHLAGCCAKSGYKVWQPFRGGRRFVFAQMIGWSLYSAGLSLIGIDLVFKFQQQSPGRVPCITCTPGFIIALVATVLSGNVLLLCSLDLFAPSTNVAWTEGGLQRIGGRLLKVVWACAVATVLVFLGRVPTSCLSLHARAFMDSQSASILAGLVLIVLLNRYQIILPPSEQLDFFGRINNLYQIIAHLGVALKFAGWVHSTAIFGAGDEQAPLDFQIMNALDYAGWVAIFSRLEQPVPWLPKTLANTHVATGMLSLLDHRRFQGLYIETLRIPAWDYGRAAFVLIDAIVRSYYHFFKLGNL